MGKAIIDGRIHFLPPCPGSCPECAAEHALNAPHLQSSLWYQMRFHRDHGRFATWTDATRHCGQDSLLRILEEMLKGGAITISNQDSGNWISVLNRVPEQNDADAQGCVLVWHVFNGLMLCNWQNVLRNRFIVYWQKTISPPRDADSLRRSWNVGMEEQFQSEKK